MRTILVSLVTVLLWAQGLRGQSPKTAAPAGATSAPAANDPAKAAAEAFFQKIRDHYMHARCQELAEEYKAGGEALKTMDAKQRADVEAMSRGVKEFRPVWWPYVRSTSKLSFTASIWGRNFVANYVPQEELGFGGMTYYSQSSVHVIVSWKASMIDNPRPATGYLSKAHGFTKGDIGEVRVWHELGLNYLVKFLPPAVVYQLFENHRLLFDHLQEFYADMTVLYHASPSARLATLMLRLSDLRLNRESDEDTRAAWAIGSALMMQWLAEPEKWPSIHFPNKVPDKDVELNAIIYAYEHIDPNWTLAEDKALREYVRKYMATYGDSTFRSKGVLTLPNNLQFALMYGDDHQAQLKRDAWITQKLTELIASGRADKTAPPKSVTREIRVEIPW